MEGILFALLGMGALFALTSFLDNGDSSADNGDEEEIELRRNEDGRFVLRGTTGPDLITPIDLQRVQGEIREVSHYGRVSEIQVGSGNDTIIANVYGGPLGEDEFLSGQSFMTIRAGDGDDLVFSNALNNTVYGGAGNDTLIGAGADLHGGPGDDLIIGRSFHLGEEARTHSYSGGPGNDTIAVLNGFADIHGGAGADTFILEFNRPADAVSWPFERGFPNFGDVLIRDFNPEEDQLFVLLPPENTGNVELESVERRGGNTRITLAVEIAPDFEYPDGTTFRASILLRGVDVTGDVQIASTDEGVVLSVNAPPVAPTLPPLAS